MRAPHHRPPSQPMTTTATPSDTSYSALQSSAQRKSARCRDQTCRRGHATATGSSKRHTPHRRMNHAAGALARLSDPLLDDCAPNRQSLRRDCARRGLTL
jgi:hypothetical protein